MSTGKLTYPPYDGSRLEGTRGLSHSLAVDNDVVQIEGDLEDKHFCPCYPCVTNKIANEPQ
jgi:hypothetical protein